MTLRQRALELLLLTDADRKARETQALDRAAPVDARAVLVAPAGIPGRPLQPQLVPQTQLKRGSLATREGHAALLHAVTHIEFNAIKMVPDAKFSAMREHAQARTEYVCFRPHKSHSSLDLRYPEAAGHTVRVRCMKSGQQPFGICAKLTHNARRPPD